MAALEGEALEARRAANRQRMRKFRETRTPEQRAEIRRKQRECARRRREDPAAREADREKDRLRRLRLGTGGWEVPADATCELCGRPAGDTRITMVVQDHDHGTGKLRGFLCGGCNKKLGHVEADPAWTARAIAYLRAHGAAGFEEAAWHV